MESGIRLKVWPPPKEASVATYAGSLWSWDDTDTTLTIPQCPYCGRFVKHGGICPLVEEIEYHRNGAVKRVKLRKEA